MKSDQLKQAYKEQLLRAGVEPHKAEQAANTVSSMNKQELQLLSDIWSDWAVAYSQTEHKLNLVALYQETKSQ